MTIKSYAESEMDLVGGYEDVRSYVLDTLKAIAGQGHSGASMGIFSGMFTQWAKNPKELKGNDLFSPIWEVVKNIPTELVPKTLDTVGSLMTYTPLTFVTGKESEWICQACGEENPDKVMYQNNRMGTIFKEGKNGVPYWLDGIVFYEPSDSYNNFVGFTGSYSKVPVTFPFDPKTESKRVYYTDRERTEEIKGDPYVWLKQARDLKLNGYTPTTNTLESIAHLVPNAESLVEIRKLIGEFDTQFRITKQKEAHGCTDDELLLEILGDALSYNPRCAVIIGEYFFAEGKIKVSTYNIVRNFLRLMYRYYMLRINEEDRLDFTELSDKLYALPVYEPVAHHQGWEHKGQYRIGIRLGSIPQDQDDKVYFDKVFITEDPYKYLYNYCKDNGLEYKGPKH